MSYGVCNKCQGELDMYYSLWCPLCDKPKYEAVYQLNWSKARTHLEIIERKDLSDWLKNKFEISGCTNDSYFDLFLEDVDDEDYDANENFYRHSFRGIFEIPKSVDLIIMNVSW